MFPSSPVAAAAAVAAVYTNCSNITRRVVGYQVCIIGDGATLEAPIHLETSALFCKHFLRKDATAVVGMIGGAVVVVVAVLSTSRALLPRVVTAAQRSRWGLVYSSTNITKSYTR